MLKFVEIEGFKSFGSPPQHISFAPLTFVVGPNASGKTNLLDCLRFLQFALIQDTEFAINQFSGIAEVRCKVQRERIQPKPLRIRVSLNDEALIQSTFTHEPGNILKGEDERTITDFDYTLAIDLRRSDDNPVIVEEELRCDYVAGKNRQGYRLQRNEQRVVIEDPADSRGRQEMPVPPAECARPAINVGFFSLPAVCFRKLIQDWSFYNISPHIARQSYREVPDTKLGWSGENLSVIVQKLKGKNGKNGLAAIGANLRATVPGFESVDVVRTDFEGRWALKVKEEKAGAMSATSVSDGTVRLLALMVVADLGTKGKTLIAIEEPENSVHPHLSQHIINVFRETSQESQVIVTTHNPAFLDHLDPEEILLCAKRAGLTRVRRASDASEISSFRKHFTLGELWVQGKFDFDETGDQ